MGVVGRGLGVVTWLDPPPGAAQVPPLLVPVSMYLPSGMLSTCNREISLRLEIKL